MSIDIKSPTFPESVADGTIANWLKAEGETVSQDEVIAEIETDKVVLEVLAQSDGTISKIIKSEGETVSSSEKIGEYEEQIESSSETSDSKIHHDQEKKEPIKKHETNTVAKKKNGPAVEKILAEKNIDAKVVKPTGKDDRLTKADVINHIEQEHKADNSLVKKHSSSDSREEERVPMSRLRTTIAKRLVSVKQETAMLTTFNEVDMLPIKELRSKYGAEFEQEHDVKLGFMGFFVIASVQALKKFPLVNASIDGNDIVYHGFQDIGVAVSTERGLVVPVIKDADNKSISEIEKSILNFSQKAKTGKLSIEEMSGGTFTITNGGIYGSLLSTPILNPPQSAILGMHAIQERPISVAGEVCVRPMMNLALSYDHRLVDGKDAVKFLVCIKQLIENPSKILLEI